MAQPTITRISRTATATDPYFQGQTTGVANYDVASIPGAHGVHVYAIDESTTTTYTYAELMAALNAHADWSVATTTSGNVNDPTRTFTITYNVANHTGILCLRSGTLQHEIPGSTSILCNNNIWFPVIGAPAQVDIVGVVLEDVGVTYGHTNTGTDTTAYTGRHEITLGSVHLRSTTQLDGVGRYPDSNGTPNDATIGSARPVDGGFPQKVGGGRQASPLKATLAFFAMADGQSCLITDNRLTVEFARGGARQDFDMCGSGLAEVNFSIRKSSSTAGFAHNVMTNPNNDILVNVYEDFDVGTETVLNKVSGAFEAFSIQPNLATHPYLNETTRSNPPFSAINRVFNGNGAQYNVALTGANNFNNATNRARIVLHGLPVAGIRYWQQTFGTTTIDLGWLDPSFLITTTNTPLNRVEAGSNSRRWKGYFCRSVAVNNRDANQQPKSSRAYTVGNQKSSTALALESSSWMSDVIPAVRTHANGGTWSVRTTDTDASGLEGEVGRGVHYLVDAAIEDNTQGQAAADYTRYTDSSASGNAGDNVSYLVHRGGIHRYQQNISLRSTSWNLSSLGASGMLYNNNVDDIPGVTDNMVALFKAGLTGMATATSTIAANGTENITLDGFVGLTNDEVEAMVGASVIGTTGNAVVNSATRTNATTVVLNITAGSSGFTQTNNTTVNVYWDSGYSWDVAGTGDNDITITLDASTDITWNYSVIPALVQAKLELVLDEKQAEMGNETVNFTTGNDATYGGSAINVNTLLERMLQNGSSAADKSFATVNTTTATQLDINRIVYSVPVGSTLTLNPDDSLNAMNYGSSYTVADRVTHNGTFTDTNGTPSFIDVVLPEGVEDSDVKISVAYTEGAATWRIGANPTLTTVGDRTFFQVAGTEGPDAASNVDNVWHVAITGGKVNPVRMTYTGATSDTITLSLDPLRPASSVVTKSGDIDIVSYTVTSPGTNSETKTVTAVSGTYPRAQINTINRLGLLIDGYNSQTDGARTRIDIGDALNNNEVADYVARYGTAAISDIIRSSDANLDQDYWRIRYDAVSKIDFLKMNGILPTTITTDANYYRVDPVDGDAVIFFEAPTYSAAEVQGLLQVIVDDAETDIKDHVTALNIVTS